MILLMSFLLDRYLFPIHSHRRTDRIDHALKWTFRLGLAVLLVTLPDLCAVVVAADSAADADETTAAAAPGPDFFSACSGGDVPAIRDFLGAHPGWANARTDNGETCLHLTGIYGATHVTALLLEKGADPNARSTYEKGLRMHPLSWNVYGGHLENIELLLEHGADANLDFDSMQEDGVAVTALDVLNTLLRNERGDERFVAIEKTLRKHGAKTMEELQLGAAGEEAEAGDEL